jgi:AcrR family transcriptional regulator
MRTTPTPDSKASTGRVNHRVPLKEAALELFVQKGYCRTTTAEISRAVGLSAAALYSHYSSKAALAWELFRDINVEAAEGLREQLEAIDSAHDRIRALIQHVFQWTVGHPEKAIFLFLMRHSEFFSRERQLEADGRAELVQLFMEAIELGVRTGEVPPGNLRSLRKATGIPIVYVRDWLEGWDMHDLLSYVDDAACMCCRAVGMK